MKFILAAYAAVERLFFHTLTRKLVGNIGLLMLFPFLMLAAAWNARVVSRTWVALRRNPSSPRKLMAAQAPAMGAAGRVPAAVTEP